MCFGRFEEVYNNLNFHPLLIHQNTMITHICLCMCVHVDIHVCALFSKDMLDEWQLWGNEYVTEQAGGGSR